VRSSLERVVWVQALAEDTVLSSWPTHLTLTVALSTQVYKWVPANWWGNLTNRRNNYTCMVVFNTRGSLASYRVLVDALYFPEA